MARKLKVFRTPIGFHDAYVAAPSQKAALEAWGSDADLFARGIAELVTDEALTREPLDNAGKVIRRPRGTAAEHLAALPKEKPARKRTVVKGAEDGAPVRRRRSTRAAPSSGGSAKSNAARARKAPAPPKPKPSRARLDEAEAALAEAETARDRDREDLRQREKALQDEKAALERRHETEITKREAAIAKAEERYRAALSKWRAV